MAAFSPGELCCANTACVLLDYGCGSEGAVWELIPHVTNISTNSTSNTPKLVTSSTGGRETSLCGTISETGTLAIACHKGTGPGLLALNQIYHIRWWSDCDVIWDRAECAAVADPTAFEAYIRITSLPINFNISGNQGIIYEYGFDIVSWVKGPDDLDESPCPAVAAGFVHCD